MSDIHLIEVIPYSASHLPHTREPITMCGMVWKCGLRVEDVKDAWLHQLATREVCERCFASVGNQPISPTHLSYRLRTNYGKSLCYHEHTSTKAARGCEEIPKSKRKRGVLTIGFHGLKPGKWLQMKGEA